ncbi:S8 family serine peptidase [Dactylosporangium sp. NPDC000244]|uniref:S8 family serine peptidase n=1 Tax=Dactylosporangium sp. NPDC000244 TaxID=3154365 RepID=UPI00331ADABC
MSCTLLVGITPEVFVQREQLARVFYGDVLAPSPWATDCPIKFDVWWAFAQHEIGQRVELILTNSEDDDGQETFVQLSEKTGSIAMGGFIVVRLTLPELVRSVLPMTRLAELLQLARNLPEFQEDVAQSDLREPPIEHEGLIRPELRYFQGDETERLYEVDRQLDWFLRLLQTVAEASLELHDDFPFLFVDAMEVRAMMRRIISVSPADRNTSLQPQSESSTITEGWQRYPIASVSINRPASVAVTRSRATVKADAAEQLFSVDCGQIGWAVIDTGIDVNHPALAEWDASTDPPKQIRSRVVRAFDFVDVVTKLGPHLGQLRFVDWPRVLRNLEIKLPDNPRSSGPMGPLLRYEAPTDPHGTHVAGVLGGCWPKRRFRGICPNIRLYDFRAVGAGGTGTEVSIIAALQAIRHINEAAGRLVIAGVNLSLSVPHDVAVGSCGWTPVCQEAERLVRSGVVVVAAAGNAGFGSATRTVGAGYHPTSISDPGNADAVITVGSTHRSNPHRHGVSYFSGRGPTADGRPKPDLIAPGENIDGPVIGDGLAVMSGTSQAAAHVSGAAAMLIARHRELLGRPERVKDVLCTTATDLGRERTFQGAGLVDVLRAIQSI